MTLERLRHAALAPRNGPSAAAADAGDAGDADDAGAGTSAGAGEADAGGWAGWVQLVQTYDFPINIHGKIRKSWVSIHKSQI